MIKWEHSIFAAPLCAVRSHARRQRPAFRPATLLDRGCDGGCALSRNGVQPFGGCEVRRGESTDFVARDSSRCAFKNICRPLRGGLQRCSGVGGVAIELAGLPFSPLALAIVLLYSYTKRFTRWSHLVLGFALGSRLPGGGSRERGNLDLRILLLTFAVTFWVAGFDVLYACQDIEFDRAA